MRKLLSLLSLSALAIPILTGCANGNPTVGTCTGNCPALLTPVSLSATDTPPSGVSVLSFQVQLTAATLNPASGRTSPVSLLPNDSEPSGASTPISIDATQLQAVSQFLSVHNVPSTGYDSLSLTFANPKLVIYNASDSAISAACPIGSVCQLAPSINGSATLNFTGAPFPNTTTPNTPLSLLIDFHLNTILQTNFSLNVGAANGVTVSQIPSSTASSPSPQLGYITGSLPNVSNALAGGPPTFQFISQDNRIYAINTSTTSTTYNNFPASLCSTGSFSCVTPGQSLRIQVGGFSANDELNASKIDFIQTSSQQTVEGTILHFNPSVTNIAGAPPYNVTLLIRDNPTNNPNLLPGTIATVSFSDGNPSYSIDSDGFTLPAGLSFSNGSDFVVGQDISLNIVSGSIGSISGPQPSSTWSAPPTVTFQADGVTLEPSNLTATIASLDSGSQTLTLSGMAGPIFVPWPIVSPSTGSFSVLTTSNTTYQGASPDTFGGLANGDTVSVSGWLFPHDASSTSPRLAAQSVVLRPAGVF